MSQSTEQQDAAVDEAAEAAEPCPDKQERDWRAEYLRETAQSRRYRQRAQRAESQAKQLRASILDENELAEYARLRDQAAEAADKERRIQSLEKTVRRTLGLNELTTALVSCGVGSDCLHGDKMVSQAAKLLAGRIHVDTTADKPQVSVLDESGKTMVDPEGQPLCVARFVASWLAEEGPHFLPASGDTGSGAHSGAAGTQEPSIDQLDRSPVAKARYIAAHGPQAYVQLARKSRSSGRTNSG